MQPLPGTPRTLGEIQTYVAAVEETWGFADCTILEQTLKLAEETGGVCKAVRKHLALPMDPGSTAGALGDELADVLIFLASIANRAGVDLADALRAKEKVNATRVWT
ncbi:MazG nucleotide pyrophosphohydrolase domain-containing protein [Sphaerisporangium sp. B11E5]|uniref:MazG nucleotide pyrophosphohydrolase domain-containing protein n=1 Tax=Sphaerisporangium sp. B11E5 TaxID=3153563 RepID=UPI00325F8301